MAIDRLPVAIDGNENLQKTHAPKKPFISKYMHPWTTHRKRKHQLGLRQNVVLAKCKLLILIRKPIKVTHKREKDSKQSPKNIVEAETAPESSLELQQDGWLASALFLPN